MSADLLYSDTEDALRESVRALLAATCPSERVTEAYDGETGPDYDMLLDRVAAICISDDPTEIATIYRNPDLTVPDTLVCS